MKCVGWKAWYTEGRKFSAAETEWIDLPYDGVVFVQLYFDKRGNRSRLPYRRGLVGQDYYWNIPGTEVWGSCTHAEMDKEEIERRYPGAVVKRGKWTTEDEYLNIIHASTIDRFFP